MLDEIISNIQKNNFKFNLTSATTQSTSHNNSLPVDNFSENSDEIIVQNVDLNNTGPQSPNQVNDITINSNTSEELENETVQYTSDTPEKEINLQKSDEMIIQNIDLNNNGIQSPNQINDITIISNTSEELQNVTLHYATDTSEVEEVNLQKSYVDLNNTGTQSLNQINDVTIISNTCEELKNRTLQYASDTSKEEVNWQKSDEIIQNVDSNNTGPQSSNQMNNITISNISEDLENGTLQYASDTSEEVHHDVILENIKVPKMKTRGRPSGSEITVIGLPARKKNKTDVLPFSKMPPKDRLNIILKWILKEYNSINFSQISIKDLNPPNMVDIRILETNTTILKKFFAKNE